MFIDELEIEVKSGAGGNGCVSFRREKYVARGGPDGGNGGDGGNVILKVDPSFNTLLPLRNMRHYRAGKGTNGKGSDMTGARGSDLVLFVPKGTLVRDRESGTLIGDLTSDADSLVVAQGGRGGKGNAHFATAAHRAPRFAQPGEAAIVRWIRLELKVMADIGLVGFPNAGKSSLIRAISAARPKVADYPFTTLVPQLGVVDAGNLESFVVADIPGIIQGAHAGQGLGHRFLRHIERTKWLLILLDPTDPERSVHDAYQTLQDELKAFSDVLARKGFSVAFTKADLPMSDDQEVALQKLADTLTEQKIDHLHISSLKEQNLKTLVRQLNERVKSNERWYPEIEKEPKRTTQMSDPLDEL
ncbi:MAG: GTPase ObgE [Acidobacteria bacterium]|nr:GTPase ObgE [Acidobacteriota bacterium]